MREISPSVWGILVDVRALGAKGAEVFSAKLTNWKQFATTFQYRGTAPSQHRDGVFIT